GNGAGSAAFAYTMQWAVKTDGPGGVPASVDKRKGGECAEVGRRMPEDFSSEKKAEVKANIEKKSEEFIGKSFGEGDEGVKAAAVALDGSELVAYSKQLGIEFYAVIDKNGVITEVSTAFKYAEASWGSSKYGDSIWHTHPSGSDLNAADVVYSGRAGKKWIFASGDRLIGVNTHTTGISPLSRLSDAMNVSTYQLNIYQNKSWVL